ncbi:MAG: M20/M25/M40 family metallo-hydrolase [Desulfitobacteriaceae bacterium]
MIRSERALAEFFELVRINSPTRGEREVADFLKKRLANLNMEVTEDEAGMAIGGNCGNVLAYMKGNVLGTPILLLSAHMDCVEPCSNVEPVLKDGIITSAGQTVLGADDKSGVVAIMEALRTLKEQEIPHGDIQVVFTVAEEGGLNGSRNLDRSLLKADLGYVLDSGGKPGEIILRAPGQDRINVTIHGKAAHAGAAPEAGISAIMVAAKALSTMRTGRIDAETTANIGTIQGGRATNIVADRVEITCESRSRELEKLEKQTAHMCEAFKLAARESGAQAEIDVQRAYEPYALAEDSTVVVFAAQAARSVGLVAKFKESGGGSDAHFYNRYGVLCAVLGTGMQKVHTNDEYIREEDLYGSAELVLEIIQVVAAARK